MKNKYLKGAHLSEKEVRELIRYFCEDVSASEIANLTKISRITVNAYFKMFRNRILDYLIENSPNQDIYKDQELTLTNVYGISINDGVLTVEPISLTQDIINAMKRLRKIEISSFLEDHLVGHYNAIIDFKSIRMFKLNNTLHEIELLESYWLAMKDRLIKSRGINRKTLLLHVKEIEFRQKFKNKEFYYFLSQLLLQNSQTTNVKSTYVVEEMEPVAI